MTQNNTREYGDLRAQTTWEFPAVASIKEWRVEINFDSFRVSVTEGKLDKVCFFPLLVTHGVLICIDIVESALPLTKV